MLGSRKWIWCNVRSMGYRMQWRESKMTVIEQRKHPRHVLGRQAPGTFRLLTQTAAYPIMVIRDISSSGIRVSLDAGLTESLDVAVEYTEGTLKHSMPE